MAMQRVQVLLTKEQKAKAHKLARQLKVRPAEVYRRALDAYLPEQEARAAQIAQLVPVLKETCERANRALARAEAEVADTLAYYRKRRR